MECGAKVAYHVIRFGGVQALRSVDTLKVLVTRVPRLQNRPDNGDIKTPSKGSEPSRSRAGRSGCYERLTWGIGRDSVGYTRQTRPGNWHPHKIVTSEFKVEGENETK